MTTIKASCPTCGEVELGSDDVNLWLCRSDHRLSYYEFTCPACNDSVRKHADRYVAGLLNQGGVQATVWEVAKEQVEPKPRGALTESHLADFILDLHIHDLLAEVAMTEQRPEKQET